MVKEWCILQISKQEATKVKNMVVIWGYGREDNSFPWTLLNLDEHRKAQHLPVSNYLNYIIFIWKIELLKKYRKVIILQSNYGRKY